MYCTIHLQMCDIFCIKYFFACAVQRSFLFLIHRKIITNYTIEEKLVIQSLWMNSPQV